MKSNITNDKVIDYINSYYKPLNHRLLELREAGEANNVPIIMRETESFLSFLLEVKKPKKILEIGTAIGYSAAFFAVKCPDAEVLTIEKKPEMAEIAIKNIENLNLENRIRVLKGDGEDMLKDFRDPMFDFIFIDAAKSHYERFFKAACKAAVDEAIIVSDNVLQHGMTVSNEYDVYDKHRTNIRQMRAFVDFLDTYGGTTGLLSQGDGLALTIVRKN